MKARGWNSSWLEVGLDESEVVFLKELLNSIIVDDIIPPSLSTQSKLAKEMSLSMWKTLHKVYKGKKR